MGNLIAISGGKAEKGSLPYNASNRGPLSTKTISIISGSDIHLL